MQVPWRHIALAAVGVLASGCSGLFESKPPGPCPGVSVPRDAAHVVQFLPGPGRDLIDVRYQGSIEPLSARCRYIDDDKTVEMRLSVGISARKGPAAEAGTADFAFFVAITDLNQTILAKQVFQSPIEFPTGRRRAGSIEEIEQLIPLPEGTNGASYEIVIGFQLEKDQLDYNRLRRR